MLQTEECSTYSSLMVSFLLCGSVRTCCSDTFGLMLWQDFNTGKEDRDIHTHHKKLMHSRLSRMEEFSGAKTFYLGEIPGRIFPLLSDFLSPPFLFSESTSVWAASALSIANFFACDYFFHFLISEK